MHSNKMKNKETEGARLKLVITAKELAKAAVEKEKTRLRLVEFAKHLAVTAKEKEDVRLKLVITAKELAKVAVEKEKIRLELVVTAKELAKAAVEKEKTRLRLVEFAKHLAVTAKEKEDVRLKLVITAKELAKVAVEKEKIRLELVVTAKELAKAAVEKELVIGELIESEGKFRSIFDSTNDSIFIHNLDGKVVEVNDTACKTLGYTKKELLLLSPNKIDSPKFAKNVPARIKEVLQKGSSLFETVHITKSGEEIPIEVNARLIEFLGNRAIISICRNITERKKAEEKIKENEGKFRSIFEFSPIGMYLYELDSKNDLIFKGANPSADKIIGINHINLIGKTIAQAFPGLKNTPIPRAYCNVALTGKSWHDSSVEYRGEEISGAYDVFVFRTSPRKIVVAFTDITEQKKAEDELKAYKANLEQEIKRRTAELERQKVFFSSILENVPDMVFVKDAKALKFELFNRAGEKLLGYNRVDLLGKSDYDFFPKAQAEFFIKKDRAVLNNGKLLDIPEEPINTKAGKRFLHTKKIPLTTKDGDKYLLGISEDITDERRTRIEYKNVLDTMSDGFCIIDLNGKIIDTNESYCKMIGYSRDELIKMRIDSVEVSQSKKDIEDHIKEIVLLGSGKFETTQRCKNGNIIDVEASVTYLESGNKLFAFIHDITQRKKNEREIIARSQDLEKFNKIAIGRELKMVELKKKIARLEAKNYEDQE